VLSLSVALCAGFLLVLLPYDGCSVCTCCNHAVIGGATVDERVKLRVKSLLSVI